MKINLSIIVIFCLMILNIILINNSYKQKEVIKNNFLETVKETNNFSIQDDSLGREIIYLYNNTICSIDTLSKKLYNNKRQNIPWGKFPSDKLIIVIPESSCTACFYHSYDEVSQQLSSSLRNRICLVKKVKEISKAILDDDHGVEYYIENGLGLGIEEFGVPYLISLNKMYKVNYVFYLDFHHPSTYYNVLNFLDMK